jgi:hypothetical protein
MPRRGGAGRRPGYRLARSLAKFAATVLAAVTDTVHDAVPLQPPPLQPVNFQP